MCEERFASKMYVDDLIDYHGVEPGLQWEEGWCAPSQVHSTTSVGAGKELGVPGSGEVSFL